MPVKLTILTGAFLRMHTRISMYAIFWNIQHQNSGCFRWICNLYGSFFRNYIDTIFIFKADLGMIIDSIIVKNDIFYDKKNTCLIKH